MLFWKGRPMSQGPIYIAGLERSGTSLIYALLASHPNIAMFRRTGGSAVTASPPMKTSPAVTVSSPAISRSVVDLPQPEGPSRTARVPRATSSETSSTARVAPQCLLTWRTAIADTGAG